MNDELNLSIIVPLYNEEESVHPLYEAITRSVETLALDYEIIFVDDGSVDDTFKIAAELAASDKRLKVIKFRKNYGQTPAIAAGIDRLVTWDPHCGQTPAMAAGIDYASGKILITMDGDLQNDPDDIPAFMDKINEGNDIVVGWRHKRQDKLITRKIPSVIANWIIGKVTGVPIKDNGCSLKAYRANIIKNVHLYSEMHRFIPAMTSITGAKIAEIKVNHHARMFGKSKYGLSRIYKVLLDLLTIKTIVSFSSRPLLWFSILAFPAAMLSSIGLIISLYVVFAQPSFSIVFTGVTLLFGALTLFLVLVGALGELIYKTGDVKFNRFALLTIKKIT